MYKIQDDIKNHILTNVGKTKISPKKWISFSGPCCVHNGETQDKKGRAGVKVSEEILAYQCFNCSYKAHFIPGRQLNRGMRDLLSWLGVDSNEIKRIAFESFRLKSEVAPHDIHIEKLVTNFKEIDLPGNVKPLEDPAKIAYLEGRGFSLDDFPFLETDEKTQRLSQRIIIPFIYNNMLIGYNGRLAKDTTSAEQRYCLNKQSGFVFNIEAQPEEREYVLVHEGEFDAIATDGTAVFGSTIETTQIDMLEELNKRIVVVPDREASGQTLIDVALTNHWGVAFPEWEDDVKDAAKALQRYGKIYTLQSILNSVETNTLKIELLRKKFD